MCEDYTFINTAEQIRRAAQKDGFIAKVISDAQKTSDELRTHFHDDPVRKSGWMHNFACPDCAALLKFDLNMDYVPNNVFTCPHCGKQVSGQKFDEAWVYMYRARYSGALSACTLSALLGDRNALDFIIKYVDFYAENYMRFEEHHFALFCGAGRIMGQGLDEAVFGIALMRAIKPFMDVIPQEKLDFWYEKLFAPICELLFPYITHIHNIHTWMACCIGCVGLMFDKPELLDKALNFELGIKKQMEKGFTKDGFWRECSIGYHYYTVNAITSFYSFYLEKHPGELPDIYEKLFTSAAALSHDGWELPALNDGWYPITVNPIVYRALRLCDSPVLRKQVALMRQRAPQLLNNADTALYGVFDAEPVSVQSEQKPRVFPMEDTNLAVINAPVFAILKSGVLEHSHMHYDPLSVILPCFSDDVGTPGYGHAMTPAWYRTGACHNCITVNGKIPHEVIKTKMTCTETSATASVCEGEWQEVVSASRTLTSLEEKVTDEAVFTGNGPQRFDWILRLYGEISGLPSESEPAEPGSGEGYEYFTEVRKLPAAERLELCADIGARRLNAAFDTEGAEVFIAKCPANPADRLMTAVIVRRTGEKARFYTEYMETV